MAAARDYKTKHAVMHLDTMHANKAKPLPTCGVMQVWVKTIMSDALAFSAT